MVHGLTMSSSILQNIAMARTLCGDRDRLVHTGTCSLGEYHRRPDSDSSARGGLGSWDCERNGDCSFLKAGEERNWQFDMVVAYEEEGVKADGTEVGALQSDAYATPVSGGKL